MSMSRNPIEDSSDMPNYLITSGSKYTKIGPIGTKPFHPTKKCFPVMRYGVSADTPAEFHTTHSRVSTAIEKCILSKDPAYNPDSNQKILTKDQIKNWPVKSIQTFDLDLASIPHTYETRPVPAKEIYSLVNHQKKMVQRPDMVTGEETLYTKRFYEALKDSKGFNRKIGYFGQFAKRHKTSIQDLKIKRSGSQGHSRYVGKPIMVTNVNSKNKMSVRLSADFCQNIKNAKERQSESPEPQRKPENLTQRAQTQQDDYEQSPEPKEKERTNYIKTEPAERGPSPVPFPQNYYTIIRKNSVNKNTDEHRPLDLDSMRKAAYNFQKTKRSDSVQPARKPALNTKTNQSFSQEERLTTSANFEKMPALIKQDTLKFKTKDITQSISEKREQDLKADPENYIRHSIEGDYKRYSNIEISVLERSRKHVKEHDGQSLRYVSAPKKRIVKQGYNLHDNLKKFEKHIDCLRRTNTNFGKQRWFYEKEWKLERLTTFDDSPMSKKDQNI